MGGSHDLPEASEQLKNDKSDDESETDEDTKTRGKSLVTDPKHGSMNQKTMNNNNSDSDSSDSDTSFQKKVSRKQKRCISEDSDKSEEESDESEEESYKNDEEVEDENCDKTLNSLKPSNQVAI